MVEQDFGGQTEYYVLTFAPFNGLCSSGEMGFFSRDEAEYYGEIWNKKGKGHYACSVRERIFHYPKSQNIPHIGNKITAKVDYENPVYTNSVFAAKNLRGNFKP